MVQNKFKGFFLLITLFCDSFLYSARVDAKEEFRPKVTEIAQSHKQVINGKVIDLSSGNFIPYATISLVDMPGIGMMTDSIGRFVLTDIPIGRHTIEATSVGYEPGIVRDILVTSSKEVYLEIPIKEKVEQLADVLVRPRINKEQPLNMMATTGARMLSVEEASLYAGGFDDPARLASSFSGVSSEGATNGISIHGNAPHLLSWRLEGVEIPNPNHFADISILGGGIFSSLSAQVLGNSDFFTGAFPAEYGNAVSGVFDVNLRNGNSRRFEHTFQIGVAGIDLASEGPLSKKSDASYIVNYRYSMTGLVDKTGLMDMGRQSMDYQDLNFKLNLPTRRHGTFTVWGTGFIDNFETKPTFEKPWEYYSDNTNSASTQYMLATGIGYNRFLGHGRVLKTTLAQTFFKEDASVDWFGEQQNRIPYLNMYRKSANLIADIAYTQKFSARFTNCSGITYTRMFYHYNMNKSPYFEQPMMPVYDGEGDTGLLSAYLSNAWQMNEQLTMNFGLNCQWLSLNGTWTLEPRLGYKWQLSNAISLAAAYGLHSRAEKTDVYFVKLNDRFVNKDLDFTRAHHFMFTYAWKMSDNLNLKIEPFYQSLYHVPVEPGTSYSMLNRTSFFCDKALVNEGKGKNYGVDFTLERFLNRGWYAMFTGSWFSSRYCGGDGIWHDSRYNRKYICNLLGGKEWLIGRRKQNMLSVNLKCTMQGGERFSPVDVDATMEHPYREVQYDETHAYELHFDPCFILHYTVSYRINKKNFSHEFSVKHINATGTKSYYGHDYNLKTGEIEQSGFALSLPNLSYKIEF